MAKKKVKEKKCLSDETLVELGFTIKWPGGNPTHPWRDLDAYGLYFHNGPITAEDLFETLKKKFIREGREQVRQEIQQALGLA